jgi:HSP20 family molecular chaperone IbpA
LLPRDGFAKIALSRVFHFAWFKRREQKEGSCHYQMEISYSHFERCVTLPINLDRASLSVEHREGMLLIHIQPEAAR